MVKTPGQSDPGFFIWHTRMFIHSLVRLMV